MPSLVKLGDPVVIEASLSAQNGVWEERYGLDLEWATGQPNVTAQGWVFEVQNPPPGPDFLDIRTNFQATASNILIPSATGAWLIEGVSGSSPSTATVEVQ